MLQKGLAMNIATPAQIGKFCQLVSQKGTPTEQFQQLLERGLFADVLDANIDQVNREDLRRVLGLIKVAPDALTSKPTDSTPLLPVVQSGIVQSISAGTAEQGEREFMCDVFRRMVIDNPYLAGHLHGVIEKLLKVEGKLSTEDFLQVMLSDKGVCSAVFVSACLMYKMLESQAEADAMNRDFR